MDKVRLDEILSSLRFYGIDAEKAKADLLALLEPLCEKEPEQVEQPTA